MHPHTTNLSGNPNRRVEQLIARLRRKQLDTAISGKVTDSAKYADRADRVRLLDPRAA